MYRMESEEQLTSMEEQVLNKLGEAWNKFLRLPIMHDDDLTEFRSYIHGAQNIVFSRPSRRWLDDQ